MPTFQDALFTRQILKCTLCVPSRTGTDLMAVETLRSVDATVNYYPQDGPKVFYPGAYSILMGVTLTQARQLYLAADRTAHSIFGAND